jgi:choline kinase
MVAASKYNLIIPSAGMATRLKNKSLKLTKNMIKIKNQTILEKQLNKIDLKKINKIIFITGHNHKVLVNYVKDLNLSCKVDFIKNRNYKDTQCAYSLFLALKENIFDSVILNSDLIIKEKFFRYFLLDKHKNLFLIRYDTACNLKKRAVKAVIKNKKVLKIDIMNIDYTNEVVGPFKIEKKNIKKLIVLKKKIKYSEFKKMSCYSYMGLLAPYINYSFREIKDNCWYEINTLEDYKRAMAYKF